MDHSPSTPTAASTPIPRYSPVSPSLSIAQPPSAPLVVSSPPTSIPSPLPPSSPPLPSSPPPPSSPGPSSPMSIDTPSLLNEKSFVHAPSVPVKRPASGTPDRDPKPSDSLNERKRPRIASSSISAGGSKTSGVSKSTISANRTKAAAASGSKPNPIKLKNFADKLKLLDSGSRLYTDKPKWTVFHSTCGKTTTLEVPYHIKAFKDHVERCNPKRTVKTKNADKTRFQTLEMFGLKKKVQEGSPKESPHTPSTSASLSNPPAVSVRSSSSVSKPPTKSSAPAPSPQPRTRPCPGITSAVDSRVDVYLARVKVAGGGAPDKRIVTRDLFKDVLGEDVEYKSLTNAQKKQVKLFRSHHWSWTVDRDLRLVRSVSCHKVVADSEETICAACMAILSLKGFREALRTKMPEAQNRKYVNHEYVDQDMAKMYAEIKGLENLLSEVSQYFALLVHVAHICCERWRQLDQRLIWVSVQKSTDSVFVRFARGAESGEYKDSTLFLGLVKTWVLAQERRKRGVGMQNFTYPPELDRFAHAIDALDPRVYNFLCKTLQLRSHRSLQYVHALSQVLTHSVDSMDF